MSTIKDISHASCYGHICGFAKQRIRSVNRMSRFLRYIKTPRRYIPYGVHRTSSFKQYHIDDITWAEDELRDITRYIDKKGKGDVFIRNLKLQR